MTALRVYYVLFSHRAGAAPKKEPVVIDFTAPENMGGKWLQPIRDAAERLRLAARKQAREARTPPK